MSQKSITDLNLNSIVINNSNYAKTQGFTQEENTLVTNADGALLLNSFKVLSSSSSKIISLIEVPITVVVETPVPVEIDLFDYNFICTEDTLCTFTYVADGSAVYAQNIVFNYLDNLLTITLNNDSTDNITITKIFINLYSP